MPELPDVENFRRALRRRALHRHVSRVRVQDERALDHVSPRRLDHATRGSELAATRRHGKHLFVALDGDESNGVQWLHVHFGMTGSFVYFRDEIEDPDHDRVRFDLSEGGSVAFVDPRLFGRIGLVHSPEAYIEEKQLGPDALSATFGEAELRDAMAGKRSLKTALIDQSAIAGIGNVYADEILFQARLDPRRSPSELGRRELSRLLRTLRRVLREAIARGAGTDTLHDRLPRGWLLPHRKDGEACPRCGGRIRAYDTAGRRGYWCPRCQAD